MASRGRDSDGSSMTPSERSDDERSEHDSDYETEEEENDSNPDLNIVWTGYGKKNPVIIFKAEAVMSKKGDFKTVGARYHMAYKFGTSECKIIRNILQSHGFHEIHPNSSEYNIVWTNGHLKPFNLRSMTEYQKINHFPRSYELTRKDRLFKNIQRMQQVKGFKHFDFIPQSYVIPAEYQDFCSMFLKDKGPYIVKPVASSRGRGVFLINHPDQVPLDENVIVCKYVANPLLIDGFKFDVRLYVAVTSYDPLVIYLFEEGLTRFATVKYEKTTKQIRNQCMHLTNYSVNKKSEDYVRNDDPDVEDYGNKWSLGALLRYLRSEGKDTAALMMRIEDVIMKTIISVELPVATACKMFMPHRGNCFELYGFDILIDESLKPWIIEVNLSPSLACDSPMDLKIKANMLCDLFSVTGLICHDPMVKTLQQSRRNLEIASKLASRAKSARVRPSSAGCQKRPSSAGSTANQKKEVKNPALAGLNSEEIKIFRKVKEEDARRRGWVRIFPSADSWDTHSQFLQFNTTHNLMLHQRLYPERHKGGSLSRNSTILTSTGQRARNTYLQLTGSNLKLDPERSVEAYAQALLRTRQYERRLGPKKKKKGKKKGGKVSMENQRIKLAQGIAEDLQDEDEGQSDCELPTTNSNDFIIKDEQKIEKEIEERVEEIKPDISQEKVEKKEEIPVTVIKPEVVKKISYTNVPPPATAVAMFEEKPPVEEPVKPPTPPPTPPPPEPKYDVVELLNKGGTLSKSQARSAFAMYLVRVQERLLSDSIVLSADAVDALNEQMDLVLRFLKRAAVNLQQSFKVIVPSRKLPLSDRRRILAKQLGDFVYIYNKETEQLKSRQNIDKTLLRRSETSVNLNEKKFDRFVATSSESELEDVLTTYTRINKSASIFLGSNSKSSDQSQHIPSSSTNHSTASGKQTDKLTKRNGRQEEENANGVVTWEDVPRIRSASNTDLRVGSQGILGGSNRPLSAKNTYTDAVSIYSQRLLRPRSASTGNMCKGKSPSNRPASAIISTTTSPFTPSEPTVDTYNEQAIQDALQRLALRQQARQYSAFNGSSMLLSQENLSTRPPSGYHGNRTGSAAHPGTDNNNGGASTHHIVRKTDSQPSLLTTAQVSYTTDDNYSRPVTKRPTSHVGSRSSSVSHARHNYHQQNANTTFNTFIEDSGQARDIANAYNQITGNAHYHTGCHNSRQLQYAQQQMFKQQRLMEQSKVLLEQSRAKHQAMVAQAHAAQRTLNNNQTPDNKNKHSEQPHAKITVKRALTQSTNIQPSEQSQHGVNSFSSSERSQPKINTVQPNERSQPRNTKPQQKEQSIDEEGRRDKNQGSRQKPVKMQQNCDEAQQTQHKKVTDSQRQERSHKKHGEAVSEQRVVETTPEVHETNNVRSDTDGGVQSFAPKPPDQPSTLKKLPSTYRIARTQLTNEDKGLNLEFYNSLKYDVHTGQTRSRGADNW